MYSGTGHVPESWRVKKKMFTSVPSEYRARKPWPSAKVITVFHFLTKRDMMQAMIVRFD